MPAIQILIVVAGLPFLLLGAGHGVLALRDDAVAR
jgi:hypothetical protein